MPPSQQSAAATQSLLLSPGQRVVIPLRAESVLSAEDTPASTSSAWEAREADERSGATAYPAYSGLDVKSDEYERARDEEDVKEDKVALEAAKKWRAKLIRLLEKREEIADIGNEATTARTSRPAANFGSAGHQEGRGTGEAVEEHEDDDVAGYIPTLRELDALEGYIEDLEGRIAEPGYYRRAMNSIIYNQPPDVLRAREEAYQRALADFFSEQSARS